jgi:RNA polymerase sigma factor (sigma-70 family)
MEMPRSLSQHNVRDFGEPEFPPWLTDICPRQDFDRFWFRFKLDSYSNELSNEAIFRLQRARDNKRIITKAYVWTTLRNLVNDKGEELKKEPKTGVDLDQMPARESSNDDDANLTDFLVAEINKLDLRDRVIINLRRLHQMTYGQIANVVGFSESSARQECKQIIRILNAKYQKYCQDEHIAESV